MVFEQLISEKCKFMKIKDGKLVYLIGLSLDLVKIENKLKIKE